MCRVSEKLRGEFAMMMMMMMMVICVCTAKNEVHIQQSAASERGYHIIICNEKNDDDGWISQWLIIGSGETNTFVEE